MELLLTGKHIEIAPADRAVAEEYAKKLSADYEKLNSLRLVLSEERFQMTAEAHLAGKHVALNASATAESYSAAITACYFKLDKQMRRYLEKVQDRSIAADPELKEKIWQSIDLELAADE